MQYHQLLSDVERLSDTGVDHGRPIFEGKQGGDSLSAAVSIPTTAGSAIGPDVFGLGVEMLGDRLV